MKKGTSRRDFLLSAAALPAVSSFSALPLRAEINPRTAPYLALEKFIQPGNDEFLGEKAALEIVNELQKALISRELPANARLTGSSPLPSRYRALAPDLEEAHFDTTDRAVAKGWSEWVESLGAIRRAQFTFCPTGSFVTKWRATRTANTSIG